MEKALIIGASGGIGSAFADLLTSQGSRVTALSRSVDGFDLSDPVEAEAVLSSIEGPFDLVIVASGILSPPGAAPEKSLAAIEADQMAILFRVNAIGPVLVMKHLPRWLRRDQPGRAAVLTARVGSIADNHLGGWYSYRASKAAANQIVRTAAIELRRTHPKSVVVALHPGTVETSFTQNYKGRDKLSPAAAASSLLNVLDKLTPAETGHFFDYAGQPVPW